ncbi:hypothetical protein HRM2_12490 [Desulforapulum autotrophicum HRM2]|uniref:Uncharacterized protein n=2 Tax=Desulforapulum autotrophicum TaxID=2296 RepID=C0QM55_DESAH|nr:hypothetical protein HRM2_12490 [Desulforapulum autotrophicum HRM2]
MDYHPGVTQRHLLFSLLFTGEEPAMSKTIPVLNVKQRKELVDAGFIELEKRGRASHLILTDKAWAWASDAFNQSVPPLLKLNAAALEGLLGRLSVYMVKNKVGLGDLLAGENPVSYESGPNAPGIDKRGPDGGDARHTKNLERRICSAYHRLAGNQWNVRVSIAALRKVLSDINRDDLSALLCRMQFSGDYTLVMYPHDDPREITPEDDAAAVHAAGRDNHIIYMGA